MNRTPKLGRRSPAEAPITKPSPAPAPKKKKKETPRNPLKDINSAVTATAAARSSADAQRGGCLRFILSGASSHSPVPRSLPRTPKSAPPNPRAPPSKTTIPSKLRPLRDSGKPLPSENPKSKRLPKPKTPDLLNRWSRRKPSSESVSAGKKSSTDLSSNGISFNRNSGGRASTPKKTVPGFGGSATKEAEQKLSTTPSSATTPPIEASVSPEMLNASLMAPMPVCFAAGHVIAGVQDRRKCRPRGILTIGEAVSEDGTAAPPLAEASMKWLSSSSEIASGGTSGSSRSRSRYGDEASVKWLLSSPGGDQDGSFHSPDLETPSTGCGVRRTPTSGSSTSPFSAILQRAAASSGLTNVRARQERGKYRYVSIAEDSPLSGASSAAMPSLELDSVTEVLGSISLSPRPLPSTIEASFQFGCPAANSNSIDKNAEMRISWREGLISRMFEMGELGRSPWMWDEEDIKAGSVFEFEADMKKNLSSVSKEGDEQLVHGFGSVELACGDDGDQRGKGKNPAILPISCAESISTEGGDGLISSGDSDWTLFYRNRLFES